MRARRYAARALTVAPQDEQVLRLSRELGSMGFWAGVRQRLSSRVRGSAIGK
jgi:hypothetical protein